MVVPALKQITVDVEAGVVGRGPEDACWDKPWLERLLDVPEDGCWPRFMSRPHPTAVGSFGAECVAWLMTEGGITPRWWQDLCLVRMLEHDADGDLCWLTVLPTTARQSGKSVLLRGGASWRLHQSARFAEQQLILHTSKDLQISREVRREAVAWAIARKYDHREANGSEEICAPDGSRWLVRGKGSIYGYSTTLGIADEAWGLDPAVIEDGMEPTMLERRSPQLLLTSTAHRKATPLFPERRAQALQELDAPVSTLLIEWSAPRTAEIDDYRAWRQASPHWSKGRERVLEARLGRVRAGETLDPDETDPVESFRCQFLNSWPMKVVEDPGQVLLDQRAWHSARGTVSPDSSLFAAIEDWYGRGAGVAAVARDGNRFEIDAWTASSWDQAIADVARLFEGRDHAKLLVGPTLWERIGGHVLSAKSVTATDTKTGLALLRQLVEANRVVHDVTPELDNQLAMVRVREMPGGLALVPGVRADLVKASCWALQAAHRRRSPGIH
jgi:hypothetical protein